MARRRLPIGIPPPARRENAESELCLLGLVALADPLRPEVAHAIAMAHTAGITVDVVTGDDGLTPAAITREAGTRPERGGPSGWGRG